MRFLLIFSLSILILVGSHAQEEYINFDVWESNVTKVGSQVLDIHQDKAGYIWLSTFNGIIRFDGSKFIHIVDIFPESNQLPTNHISCVRKDNRGNIWIGTINHGMFMIDIEDKFHAFNDLTASNNSLAEYRIEDILHTDSLLFVIGRTGLTTYRHENNQYVQINDILDLPDQNINTMLNYKGDIIFAAKESITSLNGTIKDQVDVLSPQVFQDLSGNLYSSSFEENKGSIIYKYVNAAWQKLEHQPFESIPEFQTFIWDYQGRLWAYKYNRTLVCYNFKDRKWMIKKGATNHNLRQHKIRDVLVDNSGTVWIGSEVLSLIRKREDIRSIKLPLEIKDDIRSMIFKDDKLHYTTSFDGLHTIDTAAHDQKLTSKNSGLISEKYLIIDELDGDNFGILHSRGFQTWNSKGEFSDLVSAKGSNRSMCVLGGYYWIGAVSKILRIDPATRAVKKYPFRGYNKSQNFYINGLEIKSENELYIGSSLKELHVFDIITETFKPVQSNPEIVNQPNSCNQISISNKQILALATERGLYTYDGIKYETLVPREYFMSVAWANDSLIIASTKSKIYKINIFSNNQSIIYQDDGLLNSRFANRCATKIGTEICFGGNKGFDCIKPITPLDSLSTLLNLESIIVNNKKVKIEKGAKIILPQNALHVVLKMNQIFTKSQHQAKILYKNSDELEWNILANNMLTLENPRPGKHKFEFKSDIPNYSGAIKLMQVEFEITTPWYRHFLFWLFSSIAAISGIAWLIIRYQSQRKQKQLEAVQLKADVTELRLQALSGQMNPHFTFNALNSILQMINEHDTESTAIYIQKFSRMLRFVLEYSDKSWVTLENEVKFLEDYLTLEKMRFNDTFEYSIEVQDQSKYGSYMIPPFFIQPKIENALKHGIRELDKGGKINIEIKISKETIIASVIDNGIGITSAKAKNQLYNPNTNKGIKLTQKRLEHLRKLGYQAKMNIFEMMEEGAVMGTRINITLPFKKDSDKS
ncbi:MAG: histidine kinase [Saprospiraceae bacterium]|nr:histidine kinase [Saprospiraceae bacterium]